MTQTTDNGSLDVNEILRLLAQAANRIADGETINRKWLIEQINNPAKSGDGAQPDRKGPLLTVPEAANILRISKWGIYDLIHKRQLLSVKIGSRRFIPSSELNRYVNSLPLAGGQLL
ncbi:MULTISPECIES: helix-turn-helix domain-containing protein [Nocardia]|uniref:helix-turn-helix domain-containing protein n=1 Tax=Nocardia TaxID=1817 RepID=UPI0024544899|nr:MULTISPECIES: helix-turn-helix domain-containing protein [Nocardia]